MTTPTPPLASNTHPPKYPRPQSEIQNSAQLFILIILLLGLATT